MPSSRTGSAQWAQFVQRTRLKGRWRFFLSRSREVHPNPPTHPRATISTSLVTFRQLSVSGIRHIHTDSGCHGGGNWTKELTSHLTQPQTALLLCSSLVELRAGNTFPLCRFYTASRMVVVKRFFSGTFSKNFGLQWCVWGLGCWDTRAISQKIKNKRKCSVVNLVNIISASEISSQRDSRRSDQDSLWQQLQQKSPSQLKHSNGLLSKKIVLAKMKLYYKVPKIFSV